MWNFFGDNSPHPQGTYYYTGSDHINYYWNAFDQVLVRPDLISKLPIDSIKILDSDGFQSLLKKTGVPDDQNFSDHLPLTFRLNL